jgi:serine/threonine protein kinase
VKLLKDRADSNRIKFLQEGAIMAQFNHPNVCRLIGIVYRNEPTLLVLEYLPNGCLLDWLHRMKQASVNSPLYFPFRSCRPDAAG